MRHLRSDYNRIQDPASKIGDDEPVFLLRAQDEAFTPMLRAYIDYQRTNGNKELATFIARQMPKIRDWQSKHQCKKADLAPDSSPGL